LRGSSPSSSSTTSPTSRVRLLRHIARLVARLIVDYFASRRLVVDYFTYAARPGASARRAARHAARHRLVHLHSASGFFGTSCSLSRDSSSTTSPSAGSSSTTWTTPRVQLPRHVVQLVAPLVAPLVVNYPASRRLVVDYFAYAARPGASARRAARHLARHRQLHLLHASSCFGTSRGLSRDSSSTTSPRASSLSTTSPTPRVRVPRHVARLVTRLVVDYFTYAARPGALARRVAHHTARRAARRRLLRLRRTSGCLGTSRDLSCGSSRRSSSTTSASRRLVVDYFAYAARPVPRHVMRLVTRLVVDYFTYAACPVASARRAASRVTHRRLLRLA
jgi:hypothetical protein